MTTPPTPFRTDQVPVLDLARGLLALLVFFSHATLWTGALPRLQVFFKLGGMAVDGFMFISGFLMMWHYLDREGREPWLSPGTWGSFWIRRFFRMAPLYWVILTVVYVACEPLNDWIGEIHRSHPLPWAGTEVGPERIDRELGLANVAAHYSFLFGFIPRFASNNPLPDWSIGLEMQYYLAFPFLAIAIRCLGWGIASLLMFTAWQLAVSRIGVGLTQPDGPWGWFPLPTFLPLRLGLFLSGMLAARAVASLSNLRTAMVPCLASVACMAVHHRWLAVAVAMLLGWEIIRRRESMPPTVHSSVALFERWLGSRPVRFLADCSYGVYLWHVPVQVIAMIVLMRAGFQMDENPAGRFLILSGIALPVTYAVAWMSHCWIEQPGIRWGRALLKRQSAGKAS